MTLDTLFNIVVPKLPHIEEEGAVDCISSNPKSMPPFLVPLPVEKLTICPQPVELYHDHVTFSDQGNKHRIGKNIKFKLKNERNSTRFTEALSLCHNV